MKQIALIHDDAFLKHLTPPGHPERPDRLRSLIVRLRESPQWKTYLHLKPVQASRDDILAVHSREHLALIEKTCAAGGGLVDDGDTHVVRESFQASLIAAGAVI